VFLREPFVAYLGWVLFLAKGNWDPWPWYKGVGRSFKLRLLGCINSSHVIKFLEQELLLLVIGFGHGWSMCSIVGLYFFVPLAWFYHAVPLGDAVCPIGKGQRLLISLGESVLWPMFEFSCLIGKREKFRDHLWSGKVVCWRHDYAILKRVRLLMENAYSNKILGS
jgi:hypothetical protein